MDRVRKLEAKVASLERRLEKAQGSIIGLLKALKMQHNLNVYTATNLGAGAEPLIQAHFLSAKHVARTSADIVQISGDLRRPLVRSPFVRGQNFIAREMVRGLPRMEPLSEPET